VAVDASGSAYSTGWSNEGFLTKYDASGNLLWSQQIGGGAGSNSVAVDAFGNSYISGDRNAGAFLTKCDGSGSVLWSQQIDGAWSNSVAVDVSGNAYISGDTGDKLFAPNAGGNDAFLIKFEAPEPATLTLLALGGLAMLRRRK
jgi:hypothetical protein